MQREQGNHCRYEQKGTKPLFAKICSDRENGDVQNLCEKEA